MSRLLRSLRSRLGALTVAALLFALPRTAGAVDPCVVPDAGGTVHLPPPGCGYVSPSALHMILNGLPAGTTIEIGVEHSRFFNDSISPGGTLGGNVERFQSTLRLDMNGTGGLAYSRTVTMQANCETHTAPRTPGQPVQSFDTDMFRIQGQLPPGDPDFDLLRVTAGTGFGMPSPGHTTLTQQPGGNWAVDSFFDITYRIDFVGRAGGPFSGMSGSTTGTIRMGAGVPAPQPCTVVDNGSGTIDLPPAGCGYVSPADLHRMIDGLPPGTTIKVGAEHREFFNSHSSPGGSLGGEIEQFSSNLRLRLEGTGGLDGYVRTVHMPNVQCQTHTAPRAPGSSPQSFETDMFQLQGQLPPGDPDFDLLRITAGSGFGMPSPGHTTLTRLGPPGSNWAVDSFFDITYRIDFVGRPGGPLGGMSGSTTGTIRMQTGQPGTADVLGGPRIGGRIALSSRPNPFERGTMIEYRLPSPAPVRLAVYDVAGKRVRTLIDRAEPAGPHAMYWDGRDDAGRRVAAGAYFVRLAVNGTVSASRRVTVIR